MNQMVKDKDKDKDKNKNNSSNSLVLGRWPQTKMKCSKEPKVSHLII